MIIHIFSLFFVLFVFMMMIIMFDIILVNRFFRVFIVLILINPLIVINGEPLWQPLLNISDDIMNKLFLPKYFHSLTTNHDIQENQNLSLDCRQDIQLALEAFHQRSAWAFKLFNSWGKFIPNGLFQGTLTDYGDYDQCLSIVQPRRTKYCLINIAFPMPQPIPKHHNIHHSTPNLLPIQDSDQISSYNENQIDNYLAQKSIYRYLEKSSSIFYYAHLQRAICLPRSCSNADIETILTDDIKETGFKFKNLSCQFRSVLKWNKPNLAQALSIILVFIIGTLTLIATIYDWTVPPKKSYYSCEKFFLCFSPIRNVRKLMSTKSERGDLDCIHGLRFITIVWIIMCHTLDWNNFNVFRDTFMIKDKLSDWKLLPLFRGHFSVESFFYISGLLASYMTLKYTKGEFKNFSFKSYLLLRYIRLTLPLISFMLLSSILPLLFDGPLWMQYNNRMIGQCNHSWWRNLVYIQNFIDIENICALHTWFLAADMQLHWIALLPVVVMLIKGPRIGIYFTEILVVIFTLVTGYILYQARFPPGFVLTSRSDFLDENGQLSTELARFFHSWNHANVYLIGFILGIYLHLIGQNNSFHYEIKKFNKFVLWFLVLVGYLFCIYSNIAWIDGRPYNTFDANHDDHSIWSALIFPINRLVWSLMITLVIWLCITKNGIFVDYFLSWPALRPLSRMTYSVYLVHAWIFTIVMGTKRNPIDIHPASMMFLWTSIIIGSYVVGFFFTIFFESPFIQMTNIAKKSDQSITVTNEKPSVSLQTLEIKV